MNTERNKEYTFKTRHTVLSSVHLIHPEIVENGQ